MEGFYIAALNTRTGEFKPVEDAGIFNNPEDALENLRNRPNTVEEPNGFFHEVRCEELSYVVLPLTEEVRRNWFYPREYSVFFHDRNGYFTVGQVKSIIDITDLEIGDSMFESLRKQLGASDIMAICYAEDVRTNEIEFDVTR